MIFGAGKKRPYALMNSSGSRTIGGEVLRIIPTATKTLCTS